MAGSMFIETDRGAVNAAHIESITRVVVGKRRYTRVVTASGAEHDVSGHMDPGKLGVVVPAAPGFEVLTYWADSEGISFPASPSSRGGSTPGASPIPSRPMIWSQATQFATRTAAWFSRVCEYESEVAWLEAKREEHKQREADDLADLL